MEFGSPVIVLKARNCPTYGATRKRRVIIDDHVSVIEVEKLLLGCHTDLLVVRSGDELVAGGSLIWKRGLSPSES